MFGGGTQRVLEVSEDRPVAGFRAWWMRELMPPIYPVRVREWHRRRAYVPHPIDPWLDRYREWLLLPLHTTNVARIHQPTAKVAAAWRSAAWTTDGPMHADHQPETSNLYGLGR